MPLSRLRVNVRASCFAVLWQVGSAIMVVGELALALGHVHLRPVGAARGCVSVCLSVCLSVYLHVCLSVYPSVILLWWRVAATCNDRQVRLLAVGRPGAHVRHSRTAAPCATSATASWAGTCTNCGTLCYICDCIVGWRCKSCETDCNECIMGITPATSSPMCQRVHSSASSSPATPATAT